MRPTFALFQSHLDLAHKFWSKLVLKENLVVDATCGNGHDAVFLATLTNNLILIDIQEEALDAAKKRLASLAASFHKICHSKIDEVVPIGKAKLIVYNLGYLPGSDKALTTRTETTLQSVTKALSLVMAGGAVSVTCYPGHEEGKRERDALYALCSALDPKAWSVSNHRWMNRNEHPELLLVQKKY